MNKCKKYYWVKYFYWFVECVDYIFLVWSMILFPIFVYSKVLWDLLFFYLCSHQSHCLTFKNSSNDTISCLRSASWIFCSMSCSDTSIPSYSKDFFTRLARTSLGTKLSASAFWRKNWANSSFSASPAVLSLKAWVNLFWVDSNHPVNLLMNSLGSALSKLMHWMKANLST